MNLPHCRKPSCSRLGLALAVSLVIHGALLAGRLPEPPSSAASPIPQPIRLTLRKPAPVLNTTRAEPTTVSASELPLPTPPRQPTSRPQHTGVTQAHLTPDTRRHPQATVSTAEKTEEAPLDMDSLRAQAREFSAESTHGSVRRDNHGNAAWERSGETPERAALPSLARHLPPSQERFIEERLNNGSRSIRFTGDRCMKIPRELPMGFKNDHGPNYILATNCPRN